MENSTRRPLKLQGYTVERFCHCGKIFVTINYNPATGKILEVLVRFGRSGACGSMMANGTAQLITAGLRAGMPVKDAISALAGQGCHLGLNTCMSNMAEAISCVVEALEDERDIDEVLEDRFNLEFNQTPEEL